VVCFVELVVQGDKIGKLTEKKIKVFINQLVIIYIGVKTTNITADYEGILIAGNQR